MDVSVAIKRLENMTTIATNVGDLTDARVLPYVQTFLYKVRRQKGSDQNEESICLICHKKFEISESGTAALPKEYAVVLRSYWK